MSRRSALVWSEQVQPIAARRSRESERAIAIVTELGEPDRSCSAVEGLEPARDLTHTELAIHLERDAGARACIELHDHRLRRRGVRGHLDLDRGLARPASTSASVRSRARAENVTRHSRRSGRHHRIDLRLRRYASTGWSPRKTRTTIAGASSNTTWAGAVT